MNRFLHIIFLTIFFVECSPESSKTDNKSPYSHLCVLSSKDSIQRCVPSSKDLYIDVFQILDKINLYHLVPDSGKLMGSPKQIIIDTLGGKVLVDTVFSDSMGFYMDDFYYNKYEYGGAGFLKRFTYTDNIKPEDCIEVSYLYQENKLREILAINPNQSTSFGNTRARSNDRFVPDTLYKVKLVYKSNNLLDRIVVVKDSMNSIYYTDYKL